MEESRERAMFLAACKPPAHLMGKTLFRAQEEKSWSVFEKRKEGRRDEPVGGRSWGVSVLMA